MRQHIILRGLVLRLSRLCNGYALGFCLVIHIGLSSMMAAAESDVMYQETADLIALVRSDQLDYLKNHEKITRAFTVSKANAWDDLHLQAAAIYAELLFRQERYEDQIRHINTYLPQITPDHNKVLYLLMLESKIRYLARVKNKEQGDAIVKYMENMSFGFSEEESVIAYRSFAYHFTAFDMIEKTLEISVSGLEKSERIGDHGSSGFFLQKISDAHNILDKKNAAVGYVRRAVEEYKKTQDEHLTAKSYWSLGNVLMDLGKIDGALFNFKRALRYFKDVGMQKGIVFAQYSIANIEHSRGKNTESLEILKDNIERAERAGIGDMQLASMILKTDIYRAQDQWDAANAVSDSIVPIVDKFSRAHYKARYFMARYELKKRLGRYEEAFESIEKYVEYSEKHLKSVNNDNVEALQAQLELRKNEVEMQKIAQQEFITQLQEKDEAQELTIHRLKTIVVLILLLAVALLAYWQFNGRRKSGVMRLRMH